ALQGFSAPARTARASLQAYRSQVRQAASRAPAHAEASNLPVRPLSQRDWKPFTERLERAAAGPEALARRQCALAPRPTPDCARRFADSLAAQLDFSEALGHPRGGE
ncbi:MAG: hypothetical protein ACXU86_15035, partial [Archangium sp.]